MLRNYHKSRNSMYLTMNLRFSYSSLILNIYTLDKKYCILENFITLQKINGLLIICQLANKTFHDRTGYLMIKITLTVLVAVVYQLFRPIISLHSCCKSFYFEIYHPDYFSFQYWIKYLFLSQEYLLFILIIKRVVLRMYFKHLITESTNQ